MVGLNHELAVELLWREFPSDTARDLLPRVLGHARHRRRRSPQLPPIHEWSPAAGLGEQLRRRARTSCC